MKTVAVLLLLAFAAPKAVPAEITEVDVIGDPAVYGEYPKNYQAIIINWLGTILVDFASAKIEWGNPPKPAELSDKSGKKLAGYLVEFKVNSRNRFGARTGMQKHGALIRDGQVIKGTGFGF
jgi:hypothetical protein